MYAGVGARTWRLSETWKIRSTNANIGGADTDTALGALTAPPSPQLTQKEYLIAVRNRLFTVEEQIWLHEYAIARGSTKSSSSSSSPPPATAATSTAKKIEPLSESKYAALLRARGELLEEYPLTKLHTDLYDAQKNNLTYAAIYLERLISDLSRQLPSPMDHVNQIAVLSFSGQVMNLMRGQGALYHHLLPANVLAETVSAAALP